MKTLNKPFAIALLGASVCVATLGVLGCLNKGGQNAPLTYFKTIEEVQPYVEPYPRAYVLTDKSIETEVKTEKSAGRVEFTFARNGGSIDEEYYTYDDSAFRYVGTSQEDLEPGIPILKFPMTVGDKWDWKGKYKIPSKEWDARATVSTSSERMKTVIGEFTAVRSEVVLLMDSGSSEPAKWTLTFWTVPKRGIIKREIEYGMTREPMPIKGDDGGQ